MASSSWARCSLRRPPTLRSPSSSDSWPSSSRRRTSSAASSSPTACWRCSKAARPPRRRQKQPVPNDAVVTAGSRRRIFGAHAAHCLPYLRHGDPKGVRSSLAHPRMRALRCSAAPSIWTTCAPNLSARSPSVTLVIVGGTTKPQLDEAVGVFIDTGFQLARWLSPYDDTDAVLALTGDSAVVLKDAD